MRKLVLSLSLIAASSAYVAGIAMSKDGGVQALLDRVTFRSSAPALPPLDLDASPAAADQFLAPPPPTPLSRLAAPTTGTTILAFAGPPSTATSATALPSPPSDHATTASIGAAGSDAVVAPGQPPASLSGRRIVPPLPHPSPRRSAVQQSPAIALNGPVAVTSSQPASPLASTAPVAPPANAVAGPSVPSGLYRDGAYTGARADAYYGIVQVRAHVTGGKLSSVEILAYPADRRTSREINGYALPALEREVVRAQNANVNIVSGATLTTGAYTRSLNAALSQAR